MAKILEFQPLPNSTRSRAQQADPALGSDHSAEIIVFPGVRIERRAEPVDVHARNEGVRAAVKGPTSSD